MDWARDYLGQRGLATKYLVEEIDPKVDPLSPDEQDHLGHRPADRHDGLHRRALLGHHQGPADRRDRLLQLRRLLGRRAEDGRLGHDHLRGRVGQAGLPANRRRQAPSCATPRGCGASRVWETEAALKKMHQDPQMPRDLASGAPARTGCCSPASSTTCTAPPAAPGVGAVMGSKNLKAIAVRGTKGVGNIARPEGVHAAATAAKKKSWPTTRSPGRACRRYGTQVLMNVINEIGALPTRNHRDVAVRRREGHLGRSDDRPAPHRRQGEPGDQPGLLRLHDRVRAHLQDRREPLTRCENKPAILGRVRRPRIRGRVGAGCRQRRQRPRGAAPTPTSSATRTASTRSPSGRRWAP